MPFRSTVVSVIASLCVLSAGLSASEFSFRTLGREPGIHSRGNAYAISQDGRVVVGDMRDGVTEAYRWTLSDGMQLLGRIGGVNPASIAHDVSSDGSVVVGGSGAPFLKPMRWSEATGMELIPVGNAPRRAYGVSGDGRYLVGYDSGGPRGSFEEAVRWSDAGQEWLGQLSNDLRQGHANRASADGSVIVGKAAMHNVYGEAFRWKNGVMTGLGFMGPRIFGIGSANSDAKDVSPDGTIVIGGSTTQTADKYEAFRWTEMGGFTALGDLPGGKHWSEATGVSADGSVVVGNSISSTQPYSDYAEAFIWDAQHGMRNLRRLLIENGVDVGPWFFSAADVSGDGRTIVGTVHDPVLLTFSPFVVTVPEPSSIAFAIVGLIAFAVIAKRRFA